MGEKILSILERENRPSVSNLLYFIGGLMEIIILISMVSPFQIGSEFLDKINWTNSFSDSNKLAKVAFWGVIIYIIIHVLCILAKDLFTYAKNSIFKQVWVYTQTVDDTIDLIASITSFIFIATVFIQQYKTGEILIGKEIQFVYFIIAFRFLNLIIYHFYHKNRNIVEGTIQKHPDLD